MSRLPPSFEPRRFPKLREELVARARAWMDDWRPRNERVDFGAAVLEIGARLEAEVTQRLDRVPEKAFRGFLQWLGIRGRPGLAARLPVAFRMTSSAEDVDAPPGVRLQALVDPAPLTFETDAPLRLVTANLVAMAGADPERDLFTLPPPALFRTEPPPAEPNEWLLKSPGPIGATRLQLEPEAGLAPDIVIADAKSGRQYRVVAVKDGIVTIEPKLEAALDVAARLVRVETFAAFDDVARDRQEHVLYLGAKDALDIATEAVIEIRGSGDLPSDATWEFWGKLHPAEPDAVPIWRELVPAKVGGRLLLVKPAGAVEPRDVDGRPSRWLRARHHGSRAVAKRAAALRMLVNCNPDALEWPAAVAKTMKDLGPKDPPVALEGVANTTPLVLNAPFYPFGRDPRIFDAFYVGAKEAFSKPRADVTLDIHIDDSFSSALAGGALGDNGRIAVAIGLDGKLHRLEWKAGTKPAFFPPTQPDVLPSVLLTTRVPPEEPAPSEEVTSVGMGLQPGLLCVDSQVYVTAAAGPDVWMWSRLSDDVASRWDPLGRPARKPAEPPVIAAADTVVVQQESTGAILAYAVFDQRIHHRPVSSGTWELVELLDGPNTVDVVRLVPVVRLEDEPKRERVFEEDGFVCVGKDGTLFYKRGADVKKIAAPLVDPLVYPLAIRIGNRLELFAKRKSKDEIVFVDLVAGAEVRHAGAKLVGNVLAFDRPADGVVVIFVDEFQGSRRPAVWNPSSPDAPDPGSAPAGSVLSGGPLRTKDYLLIPGDRGDVLAWRFGKDQSITVRVHDGALFQGPLGALPGPWLLDLTPQDVEHKQVTLATTMFAVTNGEWVVKITATRHGEADPVEVDVYQIVDVVPNKIEPWTGNWDGEKRLRLADDDPNQDEHAQPLFWVMMEGDARIVEFDTREDRVVVMKQALPGASKGKAPKGKDKTSKDKASKDAKKPIQYRRLKKLETSRQASLRPFIETDESPSRFAGAAFEFPASFDPRRQHQRGASEPRKSVVLAHAWETAPPDGEVSVNVLYDAFETFERVEPPQARNPDLSWEYWNGSGWWQIDALRDSTGNLVRSGLVTFPVPTDLAPTDVGGRTNHWIRARLIGGDYGEETVYVQDDATAGTHTVVRNRDKIHPPYVVSVVATYEVCTPIVPDIVLARDNGRYRDQTEANRTADAVVEYYTSLGQALARMTNTSTGDQAEPVGTQSPVCVVCATGAPWSDDVAPAGIAADDGGRAIYLCFDREIVGTPINLLFLVEDREHDGAFPLRIEALLDGRFEPILATDGTRGLSESGIVTLTLEVSPRLHEIFGSKGHWLRLRPNALFDATKWRPLIRGVYVNGVWATEAETQELELLGSSDGRPGLTVHLARPPVLAESPAPLQARGAQRTPDGLVLRVREHVSDEEIRDLNRADPDTVVQIDHREGWWVRWTEIADLADAEARDRVYELEEASGRITFGDGLHGRVPPIGRDMLLAVRYRRGGGAAANRIAAGSEMNLITPLPGVDGVVVPVGAAGGSDPQDPATTIRFAPANLAMQDRALALADFERLALQFSPTVAQARTLTTATGVRVVVAMRGENPTPSREAVRALEEYLRARVSPALAAPGRLRVVPVRLVPARVDVDVVVDASESTGVVGRETDRRVRALLDPAVGGHDGTGWRCGELPLEEDVAAKLIGIAHLEEVDSIALWRVADDGSLAPLDATSLRPMELLHLVPDGVRVHFRVAESGVAA